MESKEEELEILAAKGYPMPEGMDSADQLLYENFRLLHRCFKLGAIDRDNAKRERAEILRAYKEARFNLKMWEASVKRWERLAGPVSDYWREPTIEKANSIIDMVYNCEHEWKKGEKIHGNEGGLQTGGPGDGEAVSVLRE